MEIRDYKAGDERAILDLFQLSFGKPLPAAYWQWRFADNPCKEYMIKLMWSDDKLVGHYAVSPVSMIKDDQAFLTGLSMTTMTHPDYQGLGIFPQLAEGLYKDMQERHGAQGVWGFPNNNSHRGFIQNLGWKDICTLPTFVCDTSVIKPQEEKTARFIRQFDAAHGELHRHIFHGQLRVVKDTRYLNWRYIQNPTNEYIIVDFMEIGGGFVVCKEYDAGGNDGRKQLDLVDWCVPDDARLSKVVLQHLAACFPAEKYSQFNMWMSLFNRRHAHLEKSGFVNKGPVTYFGIRSFTDQDQSNAKDWWIQLGDSDIY